MRYENGFPVCGVRFRKSVSEILNFFIRLQTNKYCYFSYLYQIAHLGDDDDEPEFSSAMPLEEGDTFFFAPRALKNLVMVDELHSYAPILGKLHYDADAVT